MRSLIIAKPQAVSERLLGKMLLEIDSASLRILGIKAEMLDMHNLKSKVAKENDSKKIEQVIEALKVPSVLIAVSGKNAVATGKKIKDEYGNAVHVSLNEETAKYEIERFFKNEELFEYKEESLQGLVGEGEQRFWAKQKGKSVAEVVESEKKKRTK